MSGKLFAFLRGFWHNRWQRLSLVVALCMLPLLHPFARQTIFGPKIDGIPWCVWENDIRSAAHERDRRSWWSMLMEKLGMQTRQEVGMDLRSREALPLYLHLADDSDERVRRLTMTQLLQWSHEDNAEIVAAQRRRLEDSDALTRVWAALGIWHATKDRSVMAVVVPLKDDADADVRRMALYALDEMAPKEPSLFDTFAPLCTDADIYIRVAAVRSMRHFGKRGVPVVRKAFQDTQFAVRLGAIHAASQLRKDGAELYPDLQALQNDTDPTIRQNAGHALYMMDPKRFPKPATWVD